MIRSHLEHCEASIIPTPSGKGQSIPLLQWIANRTGLPKWFTQPEFNHYTLSYFWVGFAGCQLSCPGSCVQSKWARGSIRLSDIPRKGWSLRYSIMAMKLGRGKGTKNHLGYSRETSCSLETILPAFRWRRTRSDGSGFRAELHEYKDAIAASSHLDSRMGFD